MLPANERRRVQTDDPPLDGFLPPSARFILASALRQHDYGYLAAHTAIRYNERSEIIPAVNRDHITVRLI